MSATMAMTGPQAPLKGAFTKSLVFHVALLGGLTGWAWWNPLPDFGDPNAGHNMIGITLEDSVPMISQPTKNPVANDTKSIAPREQPEKPAEKQAPEPEPKDALLVPGPAPKQKLTPKSRIADLKEIENRIKSSDAPAAGSPLLAPKGAGQVGSSNLDTVLGKNYGYYASQITDITRRNWDWSSIEGSVTNPPPVVVKFTIHRNGKVTDFKFVRASRITTLDQSIKDAIEISNYPPLPPGFEKESAEVEFTFQLRR